MMAGQVQLTGKAPERGYPKHSANSIWRLIGSPGRFVWVCKGSPCRDLITLNLYTWGVFIV